MQVKTYNNIMKNEKASGYFLSIEAFKPIPSDCNDPAEYEYSYIKLPIFLL